MGTVFGYDKPKEKSPSDKKLDELVKLAEGGGSLPELSELLSILAEAKSKTLEVKDRRVELDTSDILTLANKTTWGVGHLPGCHHGTHDVIVKLKTRKGGEKLIKLDFDSRIIIQSR